MKRAVRVVAILAAVVGASIWGFKGLSKQENSELPEGVRTGYVERGDITAVVGATGTVAGEARANLLFRTAGEVREIRVERGDRVERGQVLAALDTKDLQIAIAQADLGLRSSELQLARLMADPNEEDVAAARALVASAEESLRALVDGPAERDQEVARLSVDQARNSLWSAQGSRDSVAANPMSTQGSVDAAKASVANAEIAVRLAEIQLQQTLEGASQQAIKSAEAQLAQAQASLAKLEDGPSQEDLELARAQVEQSRLSLESATLRLEDATITAPFDGVVVEVHIKAEEYASPTAPAIVLMDLSRFHTDVFIDELDIGRVEAGQEVSVEFDAFPGQGLTGRVVHVADAGTPAQGLVTYEVTVDLGDPALPIKADMTAGVKIIVARREDVLLVPGRAVRRDGESRYVELVEGTSLTRAPVELGVSGEEYIEILSGVEEGDEVVVQRPRTSSFQFQGG